MSKFTFAHLIGRKAKATEDDDEKTRKAKGRRAEDDDEDDENAENDDPESEDQDDEKESKKGKKAKGKKAEDDDPDADDDEDDADAEDDDDSDDVKKGRRAERKRAAAIFGSKYAAGRPDMAAHLAFNTNMSASEAISTLKMVGNVAPASSRVTLDSRMRAEQQVRVGPDVSQPATGSASALVQKMTNLYNANKGAK